MKLLDEVDIQILTILQTDGRIPNATLAQKVGLSPPSVLQRVRSLETRGLIKKYAALLDPEKLGFKLTAFTFVSLDLHQEQSIERFRKSVVEIPEVIECHNISGEYDYILRIVVPDMKRYGALVRQKLSKIKGVAKLYTSFVLTSVKNSTELPLVEE